MKVQLKPFGDWLTDYMAFRRTAWNACSKPVPNEVPQLRLQNQTLPVLRLEAEGHRACAAAMYKKAQEDKVPSHQELWAKEDTDGLCKAMHQRGIAIAQELKISSGVY